METEVWKKIYLDDHESNYEVSNLGIVRNSSSNKVLSLTSVTTNGYVHVSLHRHGIIYPFLLHILVASYFVPNDDPNKKNQVDHKDGNKLNNRADNLEWVTPKENKRRAIELGLCNPRHMNQKKGSESGVSKYTEKQATDVCKLLAKNLSNKEISVQLGLPTEFIRSIKRGKAWKHISKDFKLPESEKRNYYSKELRDEIKSMIDAKCSDLYIANKVGLPDPSSYGRRYVNRMRSRYLQDKGSTTIPRT